MVNRIRGELLESVPKCGKCKQYLFTASPVDLREKTFARHIRRNNIPVVVDFWADWCGPCKMMAPAFAQATGQVEPRVRCIKVNTDTEQSIAKQYRMMSIPTLIIFRNGREVARRTGALDFSGLLSRINSSVS